MFPEYLPKISLGALYHSGVSSSSNQQDEILITEPTTQEEFLIARNTRPDDELFTHLVNRKIIDSQGNLNRLFHIDIPELDENAHNKLNLIFKTEYSIADENTHLLRQALNEKLNTLSGSNYALKNKKSATLSSILAESVIDQFDHEADFEIVGSAVPWILGRSFFEEILRGCRISKNLNTLALSRKLEDLPNDIDIRIKLLKEQPSYDICNEITTNLNKSPANSSQAIHFSHVFKEDLQAGIISFYCSKEGERPLQIDLIPYESIKYPFLYVNSALKLTIHLSPNGAYRVSLSGQQPDPELNNSQKILEASLHLLTNAQLNPQLVSNYTSLATTILGMTKGLLPSNFSSYSEEYQEIKNTSQGQKLPTLDIFNQQLKERAARCSESDGYYFGMILNASSLIGAEQWDNWIKNVVVEKIPLKTIFYDIYYANQEQRIPITDLLNLLTVLAYIGFDQTTVYRKEQQNKLELIVQLDQETVSLFVDSDLKKALNVFQNSQHVNELYTLLEKWLPAHPKSPLQISDLEEVLEQLPGNRQGKRIAFELTANAYTFSPHHGSQLEKALYRFLDDDEDKQDLESILERFNEVAFTNIGRFGANTSSTVVLAKRFDALLRDENVTITNVVKAIETTSSTRNAYTFNDLSNFSSLAATIDDLKTKSSYLAPLLNASTLLSNDLISVEQWKKWIRKVDPSTIPLDSLFYDIYTFHQEYDVNLTDLLHAITLLAYIGFNDITVYKEESQNKLKLQFEMDQKALSVFVDDDLKKTLIALQSSQHKDILETFINKWLPSQPKSPLRIPELEEILHALPEGNSKNRIAFELLVNNHTFAPNDLQIEKALFTLLLDSNDLETLRAILKRYTAAILPAYGDNLDANPTIKLANQLDTLAKKRFLTVLEVVEVVVNRLSKNDAFYEVFTCLELKTLKEPFSKRPKEEEERKLKNYIFTRIEEREAKKETFRWLFEYFIDKKQLNKAFNLIEEAISAAHDQSEYLPDYNDLVPLVKDQPGSIDILYQILQSSHTPLSLHLETLLRVFSLANSTKNGVQKKKNASSKGKQLLPSLKTSIIPPAISKVLNSEIELPLMLVLMEKIKEFQLSLKKDQISLILEKIMNYPYSDRKELNNAREIAQHLKEIKSPIDSTQFSSLKIFFQDLDRKFPSHKVTPAPLSASQETSSSSSSSSIERQSNTKKEFEKSIKSSTSQRTPNIDQIKKLLKNKKIGAATYTAKLDELSKEVEFLSLNELCLCLSALTKNYPFRKESPDYSIPWSFIKETIIKSTNGLTSLSDPDAFKQALNVANLYKSVLLGSLESKNASFGHIFAFIPFLFPKNPSAESITEICKLHELFYEKAPQFVDSRNEKPVQLFYPTAHTLFFMNLCECIKMAPETFIYYLQKAENKKRLLKIINLSFNEIKEFPENIKKTDHLQILIQAYEALLKAQFKVNTAINNELAILLNTLITTVQAQELEQINQIIALTEEAQTQGMLSIEKVLTVLKEVYNTVLNTSKPDMTYLEKVISLLSALLCHQIPQQAEHLTEELINTYFPEYSETEPGKEISIIYKKLVLLAKAQEIIVSVSKFPSTSKRILASNQCISDYFDAFQDIEATCSCFQEEKRMIQEPKINFGAIKNISDSLIRLSEMESSLVKMPILLYIHKKNFISFLFTLMASRPYKKDVVQFTQDENLLIIESILDQLQTMIKLENLLPETEQLKNPSNEINIFSLEATTNGTAVIRPFTWIEHVFENLIIKKIPIDSIENESLQLLYKILIEEALTRGLISQYFLDTHPWDNAIIQSLAVRALSQNFKIPPENLHTI